MFNMAIYQFQFPATSREQKAGIAQMPALRFAAVLTRMRPLAPGRSKVSN